MAKIKCDFCGEYKVSPVSGKWLSCRPVCNECHKRLTEQAKEAPDG